MFFTSVFIVVTLVIAGRSVNVWLMTYPVFDVIPHIFFEPLRYRIGVKSCPELFFRKSPLPDFGNSPIIMTALRHNSGYFALMVTPHLCGITSNTGYHHINRARNLHHQNKWPNILSPGNPYVTP